MMAIHLFLIAAFGVLIILTILGRIRPKEFFFACLLITALMIANLVYDLCKPRKPFPTWEQLKPSFKVVTNAPNDYRIAMMTHKSTNWCVLTNVFSSSADAEITIELTLIERKMIYDIYKGIRDSFSKR